jgi:hypothetical protein
MSRLAPRSGSLRRCAAVTALGLLCAVTVSRAARAGSPDAARELDRHEVSVASSSYLRLFQRALLPGPGGAQVRTSTWLPLYEYAQLEVTDLDSPWAKDAIDVDLSVWGSRAIAAPEGDRVFDGDVTAANVTHRWKVAWVRLGRQSVASSTVGLSRFDGVAAGLQSAGWRLAGYGGLSVLPRWSQLPGYQQLGTAADTLVRDRDALGDAHRAEHWMLGARLEYERPARMRAGVGIHEERQFGQLGRRDLRADLLLMPFEIIDVNLDGTLDLAGQRLVQASSAIDVRPVRDLTVSAEYRRMNPAAMLPSYSVLSVFQTDGFDEFGGRAEYRVVPEVDLWSGAFAQHFGGGDLGLRAEVGSDADLMGHRRLVLVATYARVRETDNGYHSMHAGLTFRVVAPLRVTAEHYSYFYDVAIAHISTSTVEAATVEWQPVAPLRVLVGASVARTPYAALDAQSLIRVVYANALTGGVSR